MDALAAFQGASHKKTKKKRVQQVQPASKTKVKKTPKQKNAPLKKGSEVQVLYIDDDGVTKTWWNAKILFKHRRKPWGFTVKYYDDEGCVEPHVQEDRIRSRDDTNV